MTKRKRAEQLMSTKTKSKVLFKPAKS